LTELDVLAPGSPGAGRPLVLQGGVDPAFGLVFMLEQPLRDGRAGTEPERTGWEGIVDASD
jgi:hypothetical protein